MPDAPLLAQANLLPERPGVYLMRDAAGAEIYVGKAKNLRRRVSSYFRPRDGRPGKERALLGQVAGFETVETDTELEAFLLESRLIKDLQPPYNVQLRDREGYPLLEITWDEDFPRLLAVWRKERPGSRYYGPYVGMNGSVRGVVGTLQRLFLLRSCGRALDASDPRLRYGRGCLNLHIQRCAGPCRGRVGKDEYRRRAAGLCRFLEGGKKDLLAEIRRDQDAAARSLRFEEAARLRDWLRALETMHEQPAIDPSLSPANFADDPAQGVAALREALGLPAPPRRIEGLDVANLMGRETVGSLVCFLDGTPFRDGYRRFRIRTVDGQDDFACIAEVVRRRYGRLAARAREERRAADGQAENDGQRALQDLAGEEPDAAGPACGACGAGGTGGTGIGEDADRPADRRELAAARDLPPDVILVDGGRGQLAAAARALAETGFRPMALLGLAKEHETAFCWGLPDALPWGRRHRALKLLMRVRDEAHRFAQHYHHILRRKAVFGDGAGAAPSAAWHGPGEP